MSLVKDSVTPGHAQYNEKAARAKLVERLNPAGLPMRWGPGVDTNVLAHSDEKMARYTCHLSWTTSCAECHADPQLEKTKACITKGGPTRNKATCNPTACAR
ncbi:MAG: hypothetical protein H0V16_04465 [Burkholderiaceae bacterium]|nr:hypothetical protein [Burkholderiaceae bacterium]